MNTLLALGMGFFGTIWGVVLMSAGAFLCGVMFKDWFLKLITGGKWQR
tara:strand:- start:8844 stop:8987 length:144 start_codon:yes stop_codon:yes gene_type:complete